MARVLICEDDPLQAIDLADAVVTSGGEVCACVRNSVEAVAAAMRLSPDIALVDLTLADGETGVDVALKIAKLGIRVIVLTGANQSHPKLGHIPHSFVSKPVPRDVVAELLRLRAAN